MSAPAMPIEVILRRFEKPDEVREFTRGRFELVQIGGMTIGRATYQPGWKWTTDVGPNLSATRCNVEHLGKVLEGRATVSFDDGKVWELKPGSISYVPPDTHDRRGNRAGPAVPWLFFGS